MDFISFYCQRTVGIESIKPIYSWLHDQCKIHLKASWAVEQLSQKKRGKKTTTTLTTGKLFSVDLVAFSVSYYKLRIHSHVCRMRSNAITLSPLSPGSTFDECRCLPTIHEFLCPTVRVRTYVRIFFHCSGIFDVRMLRLCMALCSVD